MNFLLLASFVAVFLKCAQQLNVTKYRFKAIPFFSFGMAASEVFIVVGIVDYGATWNTVLNMAVGGALGAISAMYLEKRFL